VLGDTPHNDLIEEHMHTGSVILTIAESEGFSLDLLGDSDGLECHTPGSEDFVVIYRGTQEQIELIAASYGHPANFAAGIHPAAGTRQTLQPGFTPPRLSRAHPAPSPQPVEPGEACASAIHLPPETIRIYSGNSIHGRTDLRGMSKTPSTELDQQHLEEPHMDKATCSRVALFRYSVDRQTCKR
jgi:hypothetical protein